MQEGYEKIVGLKVNVYSCEKEYKGDCHASSNTTPKHNTFDVEAVLNISASIASYRDARVSKLRNKNKANRW